MEENDFMKQVSEEQLTEINRGNNSTDDGLRLNEEMMSGK